MSNKNTRLVFPSILSVSEQSGNIVLLEIHSFECLDGGVHTRPASVHGRRFGAITGAALNLSQDKIFSVQSSFLVLSVLCVCHV